MGKYLFLMMISSSVYASSYKDFICTGSAIPDTPVALTPTIGAISSDLTASKNFTVTLTGDATISATNIAAGAGKTYVYEIKRDGLGAHVVSFSSDFILDNSIATIGTGTEESLIPAMSDVSTPSPYVVETSTNYDGSLYPDWKAFDGNSSTIWLTANGTSTGWIKVDMGATNFAHISKYHITMRAGGGVGSAPQNWTFEGSQDGVSWDTLDTQSNITGWTLDSTRVFPITTTTIPYRHLRLNITLNNGSPFTAADMEIFGIKGPSTTTTDYFEFYNVGSKLILKNHWSSF